MTTPDSTTRVLVTGSAGYIGSHACLRLVEAGCKVVGFDDLSRGHRGAVKALQPIFKNVVKTNQKRQAEIPAPQLVHQFDQIQAAAAFALGLNTHMTAAVDGEIGLTPTLQAIQSGTVLDRPALALFHHMTLGMAGI